MSSPSPEEIIRPLDVVKRLFASAGPEDGNWGVKAHFHHALVDGGLLEAVPCMNSTPVEQIPPHSLVRFTGMVQEMLSPELYLGVVREADSLVTSKYTDILQGQDTDVDVNTSTALREWTFERQPLCCVSIPGEAPWATPTPVPHTPDDRVSRSKRGLEVDEEEQSGRRGPSASTDVHAPPTSHADHAKQWNPLPGCNAPAVIVLIYEEADQLKMNDMAEFVGVLSLVPDLATMSPDDEFPTDLPQPTSLLPRLHCIFYRNLEDPNPALPAPGPARAEVEAHIAHELLFLRTHLIYYMASALGGDIVGAEYLLFHLLSRVHTRQGGVVLGKFSLNLSGVEAGTSVDNAIGTLLANLCPRSFVLPLTIENLCKLRFIPKKDYTQNRLLSGILQLPQGTHVVVDETVLQPGTLDETGVRNLQALRDVIFWQKVNYDFEFHSLEFNVDIPVMVLSQGKSLLECDCRLPLHPKEPFTLPSVPSPFNIPEFFTNCRRYLGLMRSLDFSIRSSMSEVIESDFVAARKAEGDSVRQDTLNLWLTLARLHALSFGEKELTQERWQATLELERIRVARFSS